MALYTGINMYKKIKGVEDWILPHVHNYWEYIHLLRADDQAGGYPTMEYMFEVLNIDYKDDFDSSDDAYYELRQEYAKYVEKLEHIVQQIDMHKLFTKVENKEVCFITRNYPLAHALGDLFIFPKFYYRKLVDVDELLEKLPAVNVEMHEKVRRTFENSLPIIREHKDEWIFEIHVS